MTFFKHFTPVRIAVALAVLLAVWLLIGNKRSAREEPPAPQAQQQKQIPQVEVRVSQAEPWANEIVAQGQLEPWQSVAVKAQVNGQVEKLVKRQGDKVSAGEVLLELSDEGRTEQLEQARADIKLREKELNSAQALERSRFVAETEISRLESSLAQARADLRNSELAVRYSKPEAPFDGVVNRRYVDVGQFVSPGESLMDVVEVDKLKVTAYIPQQQVINLSVGQSVEVELLDGRVLQGEVSFVSYSADQQTRSYYIEVATPNPERLRVAGASATLRIQLPSVMVHELSPALFSLNEQGQLGVHVVDDQNAVQFYPVKVMNISNQAARVQGLPDRARLITLGAGFVSPGQKVEAVEAPE